MCDFLSSSRGTSEAAEGDDVEDAQGSEQAITGTNSYVGEGRESNLCGETGNDLINGSEASDEVVDFTQNASGTLSTAAPSGPPVPPPDGNIIEKSPSTPPPVHPALTEENAHFDVPNERVHVYVYLKRFV